MISTSPTFTEPVVQFPITIGGTTAAQTSAAGPTLICSGDELMLTAVGGPSSQWQLDGGDIVGATEANYAATQAGAYTVVVNNSCGLATSNTVTVEVNSPPQQSVGVTDVVICAGQGVIISATDLSGQTPLDYQWFLNDAPIVGATDPSITATLGGIYTVAATNGATGCSFITEGVLATVDEVACSYDHFRWSHNVCAGDAVQLTADAAGAASYQWYVDGGLVVDATESDLLVEAPGEYTVVATNGNGCSSIASQAVTVSMLPIPDTQIITVAGRPLSARELQWNWEYLQPLTACNGSLTAIPYWEQKIPCSLCWKVVNTPSSSRSLNGCRSAASDAITVVVDASPEVPVLSSTEPTTFCSGGGSTLLAVADAGEYAWFLNGMEIPVQIHYS